MKIILRSLTGKEHEQEVTPDTKVQDIKRVLEEEYAPESLRICYNNSVLEDLETMGNLGVGDKSVLVFVGKKRSIQKLVAKAIEDTLSLASVEETQEQNVKEAPHVSEGSEAPATASAPTPGEQPSAETAAAAPRTGSSVAATQGVDPALIDSIAAMGFEDRDQIALALRAAYMNPDRAVEFLFTGIPSHVQRELAESQLRAVPGNTSVSGGVDATHPQSGRGGDTESLFNALMAVPQMEEIRSIVRSNPQALGTVIQQLQERFPQIAQLVQQDPEEFMRFMVGDAVTADTEAVSDGGAALASEAIPPLREEERAAVNRLVVLGEGAWGEREAIEAYRACEENEEAAAHFLLCNYFGSSD